MEIPPMVAVAFLVAGIFQSRASCPSPQYYNETRKECCATCPPGYEKRHPCIKDKKRDCREVCPRGYFINWDAARCQSCTQCSHDVDLIEVQSCSRQTNAVCRCRPGFYCKTPLDNTCARCKPHSQCRPGYGAKREGNETHDTVCERCPPSDVATDLRARCAKLIPTSGTGRDSADNKQRPLQEKTEGSTAEPPNNRPAPTTRLNARRATAHNISGATRAESTSTTTSEHFALVTTSIGDQDSGQLHPLYVLAGCICVTILIISSVLVWKQKRCKMKPVLITRKGFAPYKPRSRRNIRELKYRGDDHEERDEEDFLCRRNSSSERPSFERKDSVTPGDAADMNPDGTKTQKRDHLTNRIEKIYIMRADTVLVGSVTEAQSRQVTGSAGGEAPAATCEDAPVFRTRYPQQESGAASVTDLRIPVEEEEGRKCTDTKNGSSTLCV